MDIFERSDSDDQHERFDQVLSEATKIVETRLRATIGQAEGTGERLANLAFGTATPMLSIRREKSEQEAVLALFRGIFGHVRNPSHHKLLGKLIPQRVMQLLGLLDYAIFVIETADASGSVETPPP